LLWFVAGALMSLAALAVATPLLRAGRDAAIGQSRQALLIGLAAFVGIAIASVGLYLWAGAPVAINSALPGAPGAMYNATKAPAMATTNAPGMELVTERLAARLAAQGGTADDWRLLAQSYEFLGRTQDAAAARERAVQAGRPAVPAGAPVAARIEGVVNKETKP
jgi:cytochrome c-type biogenesis protein CcmH/NrfG